MGNAIFFIFLLVVGVKPYFFMLGGGYSSWLPFALNLLAFHRNKKIYPFCCLKRSHHFARIFSTTVVSYLPLKMATSVSVAVWLKKIGLQSLSPISEIKILANYSKMQEAYLYAKFKGKIYMPYIGIPLVWSSGCFYKGNYFYDFFSPCIKCIICIVDLFVK